jgi:hypothetical protein
VPQVHARSWNLSSATRLRPCDRSFLQDLILKRVFDDAIANSKFSPCEDKTAHSPASLQRFTSPSANRLFHPRAGIARCFNEDTHCPDTDPLADEVIQSRPYDLRCVQIKKSDDLRNACAKSLGFISPFSTTVGNANHINAAHDDLAAACP